MQSGPFIASNGLLSIVDACRNDEHRELILCGYHRIPLVIYYNNQRCPEKVPPLIFRKGKAQTQVMGV